MQVDSPQSKKLLDNGDGDIKPNKCHDSDEVGIWMTLLLWTTLMTIVTFKMTTIWVMKDPLHSDRKVGDIPIFELEIRLSSDIQKVN